MKDGDLREKLGEARAIHYAMVHGAITYEEAKLRTKPILQQINSQIASISKKHKVHPRYITFYNLGFNL